MLIDWITKEHVQRGFGVGDQRTALAKKIDRPQPHGDPGEENRQYIDRWSSVAELAMSEYLELPWVNAILRTLKPKPADVGERVEVRWTHIPNGHLIVYPEDPDDWIVVSVRREWPRMEIAGWTTGFEAKRECYRAHPKARNKRDYWVPAENLLMVELLKDFLPGTL